ncbi:MAG: BglG family transcription antiterminator LicT [Bacilli bacterium]
MIIKKVFNNNVVLAKDAGKEVVVMGKGIAFQKKTGDEIKADIVERTFVLENEQLTSQLAHLVQEIPAEHLEVTHAIIDVAKKKLNVQLSDSIYIALTDHISYALQRAKEGIPYSNTLLWEIKKYYQAEYQVAQEAIQMIERQTGVALGEQEAGAIAMHFVNAQQSSGAMNETVMMTKVIADTLNIVKYHFGLTLDETTVNYNRFITHLRYFAYRLAQNDQHSEDDEFLFEQVKKKYPDAYQCALKVEQYVSKNYSRTLTKDELIYFILHIHRVTAREKRIT